MERFFEPVEHICRRATNPSDPKISFDPHGTDVSKLKGFPFLFALGSRLICSLFALDLRSITPISGSRLFLRLSYLSLVIIV